MLRIPTKFVLPMAAATIAVGIATPALSQTGTVPDYRVQEDRCAHIADPGLKAQCMNQSYSGNRLLSTPNAPATAPLVPTTPDRPDIVPGQQPRR